MERGEKPASEQVLQRAASYYDVPLERLELARGALEFTTSAKKAQAIANLANVPMMSTFANVPGIANVLGAAEHLVDLVLL